MDVRRVFLRIIINNSGSIGYIFGCAVVVACLLHQDSVSVWFHSWWIALWKADCGYPKYHVIIHGYGKRWISGTNPFEFIYISSRSKIIAPCGIPLGRKI